MRTKTLLIAAAALVAGIVSSEAQVYSANVVGYVSVTCPPGKFTLIGNQLDTGSNTLNNVLGTGLVSNGDPVHGSTVAIFNGSTFQTWYYYSPADAAPGPGGFYDASGTVYSTNQFGLFQALYVKNNATTNISVTLVGTVDQGTNTFTVKPGFNFYSEPIPLAGTALNSTNVSFPATSSQDTYQVFNGTTYGPQYTYYNSADSGGAPGWYDSSGTINESTNAAAWPAVGQGFLIHHYGSTSNWVQTFSVQ